MLFQFNTIMNSILLNVSSGAGEAAQESINVFSMTLYVLPLS